MDLLGEAVPVVEQLLLPLADANQDDAAPDIVLGTAGLSDRAAERRWLDTIAEAAAKAAADESKVRFLTRLLGRLQEPSIVFTEYRDTLGRLHEAMSRTGRASLVLHGGLTAAERVAVQRAFNDGNHVLLATDAAAEGLNLHGRCRLVIHFELPWTPIRMEQRAGRVDRIGQRRTVHEIGLVANDTAERLVLVPLIRKAARVEAAPGGAWRSGAFFRESRVAASVLDGSPIGDPDDSVVEPVPAIRIQTAPPSLRAESEAEALRLEQQRRWIAESARSSNAFESGARLVTVMTIRRTAMMPGVIAVYLVVLATPDGHVVHRDRVTVGIPAPVALPGRRARDVRQAFAAWWSAHEPAARSVVETAVRARLDEIRRMHILGLDALDRREVVMAETLSSGAQEIVQASLFDQRALRRAAARRQVVASLLDEVNRRAGARTDSRRLVRTIDLAAVLLTIRP
jgi:hypothetical protein